MTEPRYLRRPCVHCGENIRFEDWNEDNDKPAHRLCANSQVTVWDAPLTTNDMRLVWSHLRRGRAPQHAAELVEAVKYTIKHDRATYDDNGQADWMCGRRRKLYARRLLWAMLNFNRGIRPTGRLDAH